MSTRRYFASSILATLLLLSQVGCNSGPAPKKTEQKSVPSARNSDDPGIDLNCLIDRLQNPSEAFHYSYKKTDSGGFVDEQGDLTPETIDGTSSNSFNSRKFHGVRSDRESWTNAWQNLTAISGMAIQVVNGTSAMAREGKENMNGYDTIKYSIDTARGTAVENALYRFALGPGGWQKGTALVTAQGCPVKLSMDTEFHQNGGSVEKVHYEEEMTKK